MIPRKYIIFHTANIIMPSVSINKLRNISPVIAICDTFGFIELSFYICKSSEKNTSNIIPAISSIFYTSYFMLFDKVKCNVFTCFVMFTLLVYIKFHHL